MTRKFEFSYDKENDDLFLFKPGGKSKGSIEFGNFVIDLDYQFNVVGVQILDATDFLAEASFTPRGDIEQVLNELNECKVSSIQIRNMVIFKILLISKRKKETSVVIPLPNIRSRSPAVAYA